MGDAWDKAAARVETYREDMVRLESELVACPALGPDNGGRGEWEKALVAENWLRQIKPAEIIRIDAPDSRVPAGVRPNVIALWKGKGLGRVWVLSHLDIVPPGELSHWDSDPFVLRQEGDRLYGRGVEDNNHGLTASYFAVRAVIESGLEPALDIGLIFVSDEETGSGYGLQYVLEQRPDLFRPEDLIIVPDAGHPEGTMIEIAEKSICWLKFEVKGRQCHASRPQLGVNTLRAAAKMITALDQALPVKFPSEDPLYVPPSSTFEPTKMQANVPNVNTIPGEDVFYFDARVLPEYNLPEVVAEAVSVAEAVAAQQGVTVRVEMAQTVQAPPATPQDAPVVQALSRAVLRVHGREAQPMGIGGGTVAAFFRRKGLPAAVWSTTSDSAHAPNEQTTLSSLIADAKVLAHVYLGL